MVTAQTAPRTARFQSLLDTIGDTPLVRLQRMSPNPEVAIWVKLEGQNPTGSVKDRIAKAMIDAAHADGSLQPGQTILEPTSGNTGLSIALMGRLTGHPVRCVMPESVSVERRDLLSFFGAEVVLSPGETGSNGAVRMAKEMYEADPFGLHADAVRECGQSGRALRDDRARKSCATVPRSRTSWRVWARAARSRASGATSKSRTPRSRSSPLRRTRAIWSRVCARSKRATSRRCWTSRCWMRGSWSIRVHRSRSSSDCWKRKASSPASPAAPRSEQPSAPPSGLRSGNIVVLLADGGWKYLSTGLWNRDYEDIAGDEEIEGKIWW